MCTLFDHARTFARTLGVVGILTFIGTIPLSAQDATPAGDAGSADGPSHAQLGIEVTDSPGVGVLVSMVSSGGPADRVDIRPGDFLLAVDGKPIQKPIDLVDAVRRQQPGSELKINLWRDGEETEKRVVLAASSDAFRRADRAWLGVTLEADGSGGAKIANVIPGSPADKAGLSAGDVIVAINDTAVGSAEELVGTIEKMSADETATFTLDDENKTKREVRLGAIAQAPPFFSRRVPLPDLDLPLPESFLPMEPQPLRKQMIELQQQLQELREQLLGSDKNAPPKTDEDEANEKPAE